MQAQRLRNLTTGRLHTDMLFIYQDLEFLTGMKGIMTHQLPRILESVEPWLKQVVTESRYWDGLYDPKHVGEYEIYPMCEADRHEMLNLYQSLSHPCS